MKKSVIFLLFLLLFMSSCNNQQQELVVSMEITSNAENQISRVNTFELSTIWFEVTYESGKKEQKVLEEKMLASEDLNKLSEVGNHILNISFGGYDLPVEIFLYDDLLLNQNHIYFYEDNGLQISLANSAYEIEPPQGGETYFYNWYLDEQRTRGYSLEENEGEVVRLYAGFTTQKTYRVRFFHKDILIYEEYVLEGEAATPPIMSSFDSYIFIGWDKSFSNVQEDMDIFSLYALNMTKIIHYDYFGNVILEQEVSESTSLINPEPEEIEGMIFIGWNKSFNKDATICNVYPIYQKKVFTINFYMDSLDQYLYSTKVDAFADVVFDYSIDNYYISSFSDSLERIVRNMDIIVYFSPELNYYYIDDVLVCALPFYDLPPEVERKEGHIGKWQQVANSNCFELIYEEYYNTSIFLETQEFGITEVQLKDFIFYNPMNYLGILMNEYIFYEWSLYEDFNQLIIDYYLLDTNAHLYGRKINPVLSEDTSMFSFEEVIINKEEGYKISFSSNNIFNFVIVPANYQNKPILQIDESILSQADYIFIPDTVTSILVDDLTLCPKGIIIDKNNIDFYMQDGAVYQRYADGEYLLLHLTTIQPLKHFTISNHLKISSKGLTFVSIDELIIEEGITSIKDYHLSGVNIKKIILPTSLLSIEDDSIGIGIEEIQFPNESNLEYLNTSILSTFKNGFVLPDSVRFLDYSNYYNFSKLTIPNNHPYFEICDGLLLDKLGTTLIAYLLPYERDDFCVPQYIQYLFVGCFNLVYTHSITLHKDLMESFGYNGYVTKKTTEYINFISARIEDLITPVELNMAFPKGLESTSWALNRQVSMIRFGSTLVKLNNISGDFTIPNYITKIYEKVLGENINIDVLYIPSSVEIDAKAFSNLNSSRSLARVVIVE